MPINWRPEIGRVAAKDGTRLQTNNRFTAAPWLLVSGKRVPSDHKHVSAIAGHSRVTPDTATSRCCGPAGYHRRILNMYAYYRPTVTAAVPEIARVRYVYDAVHDSERAPIFLHPRF